MPVEWQLDQSPVKTMSGVRPWPGAAHRFMSNRLSLSDYLPPVATKRTQSPWFLNVGSTPVSAPLGSKVGVL